MRRLHGVVAALLLTGAAGTSARAQSLTSGALSGTVSDSSGAPLYQVSVAIIDLATGVRRSTVTARTGRFAVTLLPPGDYDVLVERLGYRPKRLWSVPVRAGVDLDVAVTLVAAPPPVTRRDEVAFAASTVQGSRAGVSQAFSRFGISGLPDDRRDLADLARLTTTSTDALETEGLPGRLSGAVIDGVPFKPARHPALPAATWPAGAFPLTSVERVELVTNGIDVEWSGFGGGYLSSHTRRGTAQLTARAFGDWTGNALSDSKYFHTGAVPNSSLRGGVLVSGPVIRDTAHFAVGVEVERLETPRPRAWELDSLTASLLAVAQDSFNVDLADYTRPHVVRTALASAFGRFDWQIATAHGLSVRAGYASAKVDNPDLGPLHTASLGAVLEGKDLSAAATLTSRISGRLSQELRLGVEHSAREYRGTAVPATGIVDGGLAFGSDPALPASLSQTVVRLSETLHWTTGVHHIKLGGAGTFASYDQTYSDGRDGVFLFASDSAFARRTGVFQQAAGPVPVARFGVPQLALYVQDTWTVAPGFRVLAGVRYEFEQLPRGDVRRNQDWLDSTGLANDAFDRTRAKLSPRFGFTWDPRGERRWLVLGEAGIYYDLVDPGILAELVTHAGGVQERRAAGALGTWPTPPDPTAAPVRGAVLALLGPKFEAPRTSRVSFGVSRALGPAMGLHVSGTYRHTDFLPRRHDLNRLPGVSARDQYGRPISGTLVQQEGLLTVAPGSNRRFPGFDLVSGIDADGYSDYWGVTVALERQTSDAVNLLASYTYSRSTDNWLSGRGGTPADQLAPFPDSLNGQDWARGRSDFDVPHRIVVAGEWKVPGRFGPRLAALYRYRSGQLFTPGFRAGVDANGDGSATNDPAYVDDTIPGVSSLFGTWDCLRGQAGRFAERNSCREPGAHSLDLRLRLEVLHPGSVPLELVVDALNVLESDVGVRDNALYLVDRSRALSTDPTTGQITVPLVANPNFGRLLVRRTAGRLWRVGLRVNY